MVASHIKSAQGADSGLQHLQLASCTEVRGTVAADSENTLDFHSKTTLRHIHAVHDVYPHLLGIRVTSVADSPGLGDQEYDMFRNGLYTADWALM